MLDIKIKTNDTNISSIIRKKDLKLIDVALIITEMEKIKQELLEIDFDDVTIEEDEGER